MLPLLLPRTTAFINEGVIMNLDHERVLRVVKGPKSFSAVEINEDGDSIRRDAAPGETVEVSIYAAKAFMDQLVEPQVVAAQALVDNLEGKDGDKTSEAKTSEAKTVKPAVAVAVVGKAK